MFLVPRGSLTAGLGFVRISVEGGGQWSWEFSDVWHDGAARQMEDV
jgi:hypothetical protein